MNCIPSGFRGTARRQAWKEKDRREDVPQIKDAVRLLSVWNISCYWNNYFTLLAEAMISRFVSLCIDICWWLRFDASHYNYNSSHFHDACFNLVHVLGDNEDRDVSVSRNGPSWFNITFSLLMPLIVHLLCCPYIAIIHDALQALYLNTIHFSFTFCSPSTPSYTTTHLDCGSNFASPTSQCRVSLETQTPR